MEISERLKLIHQQIHATEKAYGRPLGSTKLLAVSKQQTLAALEAAYIAGQRSFGENYIQEALPKIKAFANRAIEWHFIGNLQSNKTKVIAEYFDWIHSVDNFKIASRLNKQRLSHLPKLNVCIQVNIEQEPTKSGVSLDKLTDLAIAINELEHLNLRGLMAIPRPYQHFAEQKEIFQQIHQAFLHLRELGLPLDTLSIGTSNDFTAAIACGSTLIRLGTAIFGPRERKSSLYLSGDEGTVS